MTDKLTVAGIKRLIETEPKGDKSYPERTVTGLFLRVQPGSAPGKPWSSYWYIRFTDEGGSRKKTTIGPAHRVTLDEARAQARQLFAKVTQGRDPVKEKEARREAWTVKDAVAAYLGSDDFKRKSLTTQAGNRQQFAVHIIPEMGGNLLTEIDVPAARRLLARVRVCKKINKRRRKIGGDGAARKAAWLLSALLTWAIGEGKMPAPNPLIGRAMKLEGDGHRDTVITTPEQYAGLFLAMDELVAEGLIKPIHRAYFTLVAATGMRRGEAQTLRWRDVDLGARRLTIVNSKGAKLARAKSRTKGPETASLPPIAAQALAGLWEEGTDLGSLVFLPTQGTKLAVQREWAKIRARAELPDDLVPHGLRHSIGTLGALNGMSALKIKGMLRHSSVATTEKYIHMAAAIQERLQDEATNSVFGVEVDLAKVRQLRKRG